MKQENNTSNNKIWYLYILRCSDNSLYTGITTDVNRRFSQHKNKKGAKYTASRGVISIELILAFENRSLASKKEYEVKKLTKLKKETFIKDFQKKIIF